MEPGRPSPSGDAAAAAGLLAAASAALSVHKDDFDALAGSDFAVCVVDARGPDLPIMFANEAMLELSGYALDEIEGRAWASLQGPADLAEAALFAARLAEGRPFHASLVLRAKTGVALASDVFVSPVRDEAGRVVRHVGVTAAPAPDEARGREAALRHQFRNHAQTMTSLAGLFGQRLPPGEGRDAMEDLRARFEAIAIVQRDEFSGDGPVAADLALRRLADRIVQLYDPRRARSVTVATEPFEASPRRVAGLAQVLVELMIDLFRSGPADWSAAEIAMTLRDGGFMIRVAAVGDAPGRNPTSVAALGRAIAESLARGLDGTLSPRPDGYGWEAFAPAESTGR